MNGPSHLSIARAQPGALFFNNSLIPIGMRVLCEYSHMTLADARAAVIRPRLDCSYIYDDDVVLLRG